MANTTFRYRKRSLVALECDGGFFYPRGDPDEAMLRPRPWGRPKLIQGIPVGTTFSKQIDIFEGQTTIGPNAFVLGESIADIGATAYDVVIQYYKIGRNAYSRARNIAQVDDPGIDLSH